MKRFLLFLLLFSLLLRGTAVLAAVPASEEAALLTVQIDGFPCRLGSTTVNDLAAHGWAYFSESDGTYSFQHPQAESFFYARTASGRPSDPIVELDMQWADGIPVTYHGFVCEPAEEAPSGADSLWNWLQNAYGGTVNEEGSLSASISLSANRQLTVQTADVRVHLTLHTVSTAAEAPAAASSGIERRSISYPGGSFSITIPAGYDSFYKDSLGITVILDQEDTAYVRLRVLPQDPGFDEKDYIENTWLPSLRSLYVTRYTNRLLNEGRTQTFTVGGREMTGRTYRITVAKKEKMGILLLDRYAGQILRYEGYFPAESPDDVLLLLGSLARSVTGHPLAYTATEALLTPVLCTQQEFSFSARPSFSTRFSPQDGMTVYTRSSGSIPYLLVYQSEDLLLDAYDYLKEQYTPHMKEKYGQDLLSSSEYEQYLIGGKLLPAARYAYRVGSNTVVMLRVMDSTGRRTVIYTAKYLNGAGDATMMALDQAIRTFRPLQ